MINGKMEWGKENLSMDRMTFSLERLSSPPSLRYGATSRPSPGVNRKRERFWTATASFNRKGCVGDLRFNGGMRKGKRTFLGLKQAQFFWGIREFMLNEWSERFRVKIGFGLAFVYNLLNGSGG